MSVFLYGRWCSGVGPATGLENQVLLTGMGFDSSAIRQTMKTISLPIYLVGKQVEYNNRKYTIETVVISRYNILLGFNGMTIDSDKVYIEPTEFVLERI